MWVVFFGTPIWPPGGQVKRSRLERGAPLTRSARLQAKRTLASDPQVKQAFVNRGRAPVSPASPEQRLKVKGQSCLVCAQEPVDPAHVIDRSLLSDRQDDPRAVVGLCRFHHTMYDEQGFDLLPYLELRCREELAFAVLRFGLVRTYRRVTGDSRLERVA